MQCKICDKMLHNANGLAKHIRNQHKDYTKRTYYDTFIRETTSTCPTCNENKCTFRDIGRGYLKYCSNHCRSNNSDNILQNSLYHQGLTQKQSTIDKRRNTMIERHGVANGFLTAKKNIPASHKGFTCRSSYEKKFIDFAEKFKYTISVPDRIVYEFENRNRWYFPDFYIEELNLLIEVKSEWTYKLNKHLNDAKIKFTKDAGFDIVILDETTGLLDDWDKLNEYILLRLQSGNCSALPL